MNLETVQNAKAGDEKSIAEVMGKYSNLINSVKNKYHARGYDEEDFEAIAKMGIWFAIERFDASRLKYKYNRRTKTWLVNEATFKSMFGSCVKNNVQRYTARVWRRELKKKRIGEEISLDQAITKDGEEKFWLNKEPHVQRHYFEQPTGLSIDIDTCLKSIQKKIGVYLYKGYSKKEIAAKLNCSTTYIRKEIQQMKVILAKENLVPC